jgi:hypothetical protein
VPLALGPLAVVEGPGLRGATQAGEGRVVEDPLEDLIASTHPTVVTGALAGVVCSRHQPGVGSELVGALKSGKVSHGHQELGSEDRTHTRQTSEDPSLGTGEKTLLELLVDALDALLKGEDLCSELCNDTRGYLLCRWGDTLWALAAARALCATLLDPLTPRFLR